MQKFSVIQVQCEFKASLTIGHISKGFEYWYSDKTSRSVVLRKWIAQSGSEDFVLDVNLDRSGVKNPVEGTL